MAGCVVTVRVALVTVSDEVPLLAENWLSPAKLTVNAVGYVPALIGIEFCTRLTLGSVATPVALVTAVPTTSPLTENVIVRPTTAAPLEVRCSVVESVVVPKYAPVEFATIKFVADCGAETVTTDVAALLAGLVSTADELLAAAVLVMVSPFSSVLSVDPTSVTVPDCPLANEANVMVRFRPAPLSQTPPGPAVQETNVMLARGKRSLIATDAVLGPLLVMVIVYVIWFPAVTGLGEAVCVTDRSVCAQLRGG